VTAAEQKDQKKELGQGLSDSRRAERSEGARTAVDSRGAERSEGARTAVMRQPQSREIRRSSDSGYVTAAQQRSEGGARTAVM
jgi:hypothetical protein